MVFRKMTASVRDILLSLSCYANSLDGLYKRYVPRSKVENFFRKILK